jgi:4'-phosphopantetheinyl transferase
MTISQLVAQATSLSNNDIHVWTFPCDAADRENITATLSPDEIARGEKFVFDKDRTRYWLSRTVLRALLAHYTGTPPEQLVFTCNEFGKPSLANGPQFNSSHSQGLTVIAVTKNLRVGIDIERVRAMPDLAGVATSFCTDHERQFLFSQTPKKQLEAFYRIWTAKEALLKAMGVGIGRHLQQVSTVRNGEFAGLIETRREFGEAAAGQWRIVSFAAGTNPCTLCHEVVDQSAVTVTPFGVE